MKEIWNLAISAPMLPLTILLVPVAIYWVLSIIGAVDHDLLGVDMDGADGDHGHDHPVADGIHGVLRILNAKGIPLMVVLSVLVIYLWGCSMLGNLWFNPTLSGGTGSIVCIAALVVALILTRFTVAPLKPLFRLIQDDPEPAQPVVGRSGIVRTAVVTEREGQVEVPNPGAPLLLNARIAEGSTAIPRGTEVLVIRYDADTGIHFVRPLNEPS